MRRLPDWEERLTDYLASAGERPFAWGAHDCALFAAGAAAAMTGDDRAADFRGAYDSRASSIEALRALGQGTLLRTFQDRFEEIEPKKARRGDLIWNGFAVGVHYGAFAAFIGLPDGEPGLVRLPRSEWKRAFKV